MSPDVHDDTATQWRTPRYAAARSSSSRTNGPLVSTWPERIFRMSSITDSGGRLGRTNASPSGNAGSPPSIAGIPETGNGAVFAIWSLLIWSGSHQSGHRFPSEVDLR